MLTMLAEMYFLSSLCGMVLVLAWRSRKEVYWPLAVQVTCWVLQLDFFRWMLAGPDTRTGREILFGLHPTLPAAVNFVICCSPGLLGVVHLLSLLVEWVREPARGRARRHSDRSAVVRLPIFQPGQPKRAA